MRVLARIALQGPGQAIGLIVALAMLGLMLPPVAIFSSALAALVCLQADSQKALMVLLGSAVVASFIGGLLAAMPFLGLVMLLTLWAPVAASAIWLRRSGDLSQAMLMTALLGVGVVFAVIAAVPDTNAAWQALLEQQMVVPFKGTPQEAQALQLIEQLQGLGTVLPGLLGMSVMLSVQLALLIGRWMQSQVIKPGAFGNEYRQIGFGRWPMLVFALVVVGALLTKQPLLQSLALVVGWLPVKQGIAVMHAWCGRPNFAQGKPLLVLSWVLLIFLPHFVVLIAAIGAVDNWMNFRSRWAITANSE